MDFTNDNEQLQDETYFTEARKIPLIRFPDELDQIIATLNSLLHYATSLSSQKKFMEYESDKEKVRLYAMKIQEGIRYGRSFSGSSYLTGELSRIEQQTNAISARIANENSKGRTWKVIKYTIAAILVWVIIKKLKGH